MSASISASVGIKGVNRHDDVVTVQRLLNRIKPTDGGPSIFLKVDGLAGPKTNGAIHEFQLVHFGFKGADGRVDPEGPTLRKLNQFAPPETRSLLIRRVGLADEDGIDHEDDRQWFFQVRPFVSPGARRARYYLGRRGDLRRLRKPVNFFGRDTRILARRGKKLDELEGRAIYGTIRFGPSIPAFQFSNLSVGSADGFIIREQMVEDITLPPPRPILGGGLNPVARRQREGEFIRVD